MNLESCSALRPIVVALFLVTAPFALADHVPANVGGVDFLLHVPDGFVEVTAHDEVFLALAVADAGAGNQVLAALLTTEDWRSWNKDESNQALSPYIIISYMRASERGVSEAAWVNFRNKFRDSVENQWEEFSKKISDSGKFQEAQDVLSRLTGVPTDCEIGSLVPLGIYNESSIAISNLWLSRGQYEVDGESFTLTQYQTSTAVYLGNRVLIMFAYATKKQEGDAAVLIELSNSWLAKFLEINDKDFAGNSKNVSDAVLLLK